MEGNLFVIVEYSPVKLHGFLSKKMSQEKKEKKRVTPGWIDISGPGPVSFLPEALCTTRC